MTKAKAHEPLHAQEQRCIWMTAGILTYRLCDREFQCDSCLLNAALRGRSEYSVVSTHVNAGPSATKTGKEKLRDGYLYSRNHCWARKVADFLVRVGLEPGLSQALLTPKAFVLPSSGQRIQRRQACLWIVLEAGTLPFQSPCGGVIRAANHGLIENPYLLLTRPFDDGWLFEVEPDEPLAESADLLSLEEAGRAYASDQSRFRAMLANACRAGRPRVGVTLADGGQPLQKIADVVGPAKYYSLFRKIFPP